MALKKQPGPEEATANVNGPGHGNGKGTGSQATLIPYASKSEMEVVVYGQRKDFKAVVMVGVTPVIESAARDNPEAAIHNVSGLSRSFFTYSVAEQLLAISDHGRHP